MIVTYYCIMNKHYLINLPETIHEPIEPAVISIIREQYPEYVSSDATLSIEFVDVVFRVIDEVAGLHELVRTDPMELERIFNIVKNKNISPLVSADTVRMIMGTAGHIACEDFFKDEDRKLSEQADDICITSDDFATRASARSQLHRYSDAFDDWNKACALFPGNPGYMIERGRLFIKTGMHDLAFQDLFSAYEKIFTDISTIRGLMDSVDLTHDFVNLFKQCGQLQMTAKAALKFVASTSALVEYMRNSPENSDGMVVLKNNSGFEARLNMNYYFENVGKCLEDATSEDPTEPIRCLLMQALHDLEQCARMIEKQLGIT